MQRCPRPPGWGVLGSTCGNHCGSGQHYPTEVGPTLLQGLASRLTNAITGFQNILDCLSGKKRSTKIIKRQPFSEKEKWVPNWWHQVDPSPVKFWILGVDWKPGFTFKQFRCTVPSLPNTLCSQKVLKVPKFQTPPHKVHQVDFGRLPDTKVEFSLDSPHQITSWYVWSCLKKNDISVCVWNNCCAISCLFHQVSSTPLIFCSDCHLQFCKEDARLAGCKVQHAWKGRLQPGNPPPFVIGSKLRKTMCFFHGVLLNITNEPTHELRSFLSMPTLLSNTPMNQWSITRQFQ